MNAIGVTKLVLMNSGRFATAVLDLTKPVHLAAPNNCGKTTLVNALQFLFIDDMDRMEFGKHDIADTRRHYFGKDNSYIVFECATVRGTQCLLVAGGGRMRNNEFRRYVYRGAFDTNDFKDPEGRVTDPDTLRARLAGREIREVLTSELWQVVCQADGDENSKAANLPRLGLLPIRKREVYLAFREVFVKLLSLSNVTGEQLKTLLIRCACKGASGTRVDVASDYREQFARLEMGDNELRWLSQVRAAIDRGLELSNSVVMLNNSRSKMLARLRRLFDRAEAIWRCESTQLQEDFRKVGLDIDQIEKEKERLQEAKGKLNEKHDTTQTRLVDLDCLHAEWGSKSELELSALEQNRDLQRDNVEERRRWLESSKPADVKALMAQLERLSQRIAGQRKALENWDERLWASLCSLGLPPTQLRILSRLASPCLLNAHVGAHANVTSTESLRDAAIYLASGLDGGRFRLAGLDIELAVLEEPDLGDKGAMESQVRVSEKERLDVKGRLATAIDVQEARRMHSEAKQELNELDRRYSAYQRYQEEWAGRPKLQADLDELASEHGKTETRIAEQRDARARADSRRSDVGDAISSLRTGQETLRAHRHHTEGLLPFSKASATSGLPFLSTVEGGAGWVLHSLGEAMSDSGVVYMDSAAPDEPDDVQCFSTCLKCIGALRAEVEQAEKTLRCHQADLSKLQEDIRKASRDAGGTMELFTVSDAQFWDLVRQLRDSVVEKELLLAEGWNGLLKTLASKLGVLQLRVQEVRRQVSRINDQLREYRVSNLEEVKLVFVKNDDLTALEHLTQEDGLYVNEGQQERARNHLRDWIANGKIIAIDDLFGLEIAVRNAGEKQAKTSRSLDQIGSEGTGMTAKVMLFIQLLRTLLDFKNDRYVLHFFLDETGRLDDQNLHATTLMAVRASVLPITAEPRPRIEPLAHPHVTVYYLGRDDANYFRIDTTRTTIAVRREEQPTNNEPRNTQIPATIESL